MKTGSDVQVRVTQRFEASAERVFDAWLDTKWIGRWMFGKALRDEEIVRLTLDVRVGGKFSFVVRRQGQEIDHVGRYLELERPRRLVFTWGIAGESDTDESRVVVEIVAREKGCELTLTHFLPAEWADYADRTREGWTKMVGALAAALGA
jgi:uncharacterized protein YndB with AHSA1/START domain